MNVSLGNGLDVNDVKLGTIISITTRRNMKSETINYLTVFDPSRMKYTVINMENNRVITPIFSIRIEGLLDEVLERFSAMDILKVELIQEDEYKVVRA